MLREKKHSVKDRIVKQPLIRDTMLNIAQAILDREPSFTFPAAKNLKN